MFFSHGTAVRCAHNQAFFVAFGTRGGRNGICYQCWANGGVLQVRVKCFGCVRYDTRAGKGAIALLQEPVYVATRKMTRMILTNRALQQHKHHHHAARV